MAISAQFVNGKIVANYTQDTSKTEKKTGSDSLNQDAFLKILVAEMQYQDPLEPSSNTEWVTQMASFSQIEELQSVGDTVKAQQATNLVGKRVVMAVATDTEGEVNYVTGIVQCTEKKSDGTYVSIDDNLYNIDDLYSVVDEDYYNKVMENNKTQDGTGTDANKDANKDTNKDTDKDTTKDTQKTS